MKVELNGSRVSAAIWTASWCTTSTFRHQTCPACSPPPAATSSSGQVILKVVNPTDEATSVAIRPRGIRHVGSVGPSRRARGQPGRREQHRAPRQNRATRRGAEDRRDATGAYIGTKFADHSAVGREVIAGQVAVDDKVLQLINSFARPCSAAIRIAAQTGPPKQARIVTLSHRGPTAKISLTASQTVMPHKESRVCGGRVHPHRSSELASNSAIVPGETVEIRAAIGCAIVDWYIRYCVAHCASYNQES